MDKIMYTRPDGGLSIVVPASKEAVEKVLGPMSQAAYEQHVWERSVPEDAIDPRPVKDDAIPADREFRNAWVDVSPKPVVDIDVEKARDLKLEELRIVRNAELDKLDKEFMIAFERGDDLEAIRAKKVDLRNVTEGLKALDVVGKLNDEDMLNQIRAAAVLPE